MPKSREWAAYCLDQKHYVLTTVDTVRMVICEECVRAFVDQETAAAKDAETEQAAAPSMTRRYSGPASEEFWRRINMKHPDLYACGILLQEIEARILTWLEGG